MKAPQENTQELQKETVQRVEQESSTGGEATIVDNRRAIAIQRKLRSAMGGTEDSINPIPIQRKANKTGLPDNLKSGIENLSGYSMDDVKVHYNSSKPAQLQAHAYAQGTDIHLASGQERHLPHEAWHVVQQKQGRVKPTKQLKSKVNINDDAGLEKEADVMGEKALRNNKHSSNIFYNRTTSNTTKTVQRLIKKGMLNVVGEHHRNSNRLRKKEKAFTFNRNFGNYWEEGGMTIKEKKDSDTFYLGDPLEYKIVHVLYIILNDFKEVVRKSDAIKRRIEMEKNKVTDQRQNKKDKNSEEPSLEDFFMKGFTAESIKEPTLEETIKLQGKNLSQDREKVNTFIKSTDVQYKDLMNPKIKTLPGGEDEFIEKWKRNNKVKELLKLAEHLKVILDNLINATGEKIIDSDSIIGFIKDFEEKFKEFEGGCIVYSSEEFKIKDVYKIENRYGDKGTEIGDFLTLKRSEYMHLAANKAVTIGYKGIWKVGDFHAADMQKIDDNKRNYNVIREKAFYDKYKKDIEESIEIKLKGYPSPKKNTSGNKKQEGSEEKLAERKKRIAERKRIEKEKKSNDKYTHNGVSFFDIL